MKTSVTGDRKEKEHFCDCSSIPCCNFPETERSFVWNRSRPVRAFLCNFYAAQTSFVWGTYLWATYPVSPLSSRKATKCFSPSRTHLPTVPTCIYHSSSPCVCNSFCSSTSNCVPAPVQCNCKHTSLMCFEDQKCHFCANPPTYACTFAFDTFGSILESRITGQQ